MFAVHGYGESGGHFAFLAETLGNTHCIYAIDLPLHGDTQWNEDELFTPQDLLAIRQAVFNDHSYPATLPQGGPGPAHGKEDSSDVKPAMLLGFSMGGRFALSLFQECPESVSRLVLLAPDGLKVNGWYWFSTQTLIGNRLFHFVMKYAGLFIRLINALGAVRLMSRSMLKFVRFYVLEPKDRELLYRRWTRFRKMNPNPGLIARQLNRAAIPARLCYGRFDRIIPVAAGRRFAVLAGMHTRVSIIDSGHQLLHHKHAAAIADAMMDGNN